MRLPLTALEVFSAIADEGSLRAAADRLGLQPSTVSHQLKALEARIGTPLFVRSTRKVTLTDAGAALYRGSGPAFEQLAEAVQFARDTGRSERGVLRLTMPEFAYRMCIADRLPAFRARFPEITLELNVTEAFVDIVQEGFHAGIRLGDRIDPDMRSVRLHGDLKLAVLASPDYVALHGAPETPADLLGHNCLLYRFQRSGRIAPWSFDGPDGSYEVAVGGNLIVNTLPVLFSEIAASSGLGYTFAPKNLGVDKDRFVELLSDYTPTIPGIYLYYPKEYRGNQILRRFIEAVKPQSL
ncbi:MAG: LysR family transcriptional regulator [Alphaproteobacteria bacterium]|nr:LysR family transcriptional regulator [Alphaproteobacteria bacterium]